MSEARIEDAAAIRQLLDENERLVKESEHTIKLAQDIEDKWPAIKAKVAELEAAIRKHRDYRGDDRCWMDDEELYKVLPEGFTPPARDTSVELANCEHFIACRRNPATEYVSPQREIEWLQRYSNDQHTEKVKFEAKVRDLSAKVAELEAALHKEREDREREASATITRSITGEGEPGRYGSVPEMQADLARKRIAELEAALDAKDAENTKLTGLVDWLTQETEGLDAARRKYDELVDLIASKNNRISELTQARDIAAEAAAEAARQLEQTEEALRYSIRAHESLATGKPMPDGEYGHIGVCSAMRSKPIGSSGCVCNKPLKDAQRQLEQAQAACAAMRQALVKLWKHTPKIGGGESGTCLVCRIGQVRWVYPKPGLSAISNPQVSECSNADCLSHVVRAALAKGAAKESGDYSRIEDGDERPRTCDSHP